MHTPEGHLTYCSNIHAGENWDDHFNNLKQHIPLIKQKISPSRPFGIGLRLANTASLELRKEEKLRSFQEWLAANDCYVFTMNGFPYGGFHNTIVKDKVHLPDWTSGDRVAYTIRLAQILAALAPEGMDAGISTSPLSYRFWHSADTLESVFEKATFNLLQVTAELAKIKKTTGKLIHIDIEPEPDGLLGEGREFLDWYQQYLLPLGIPYLKEKFGFDERAAESAIKEHIQICYDVCHFAVCYEDHAAIIEELRSLGIKTGKIQISAALKARLSSETARDEVMAAFRQFNEPTYLHQVVAMQSDKSLKRYEDMPAALADAANPQSTEWRAHYHVPLFIKGYGLLQSTQEDILEVLKIHKQRPFTGHLEIETYTWEVLPKDMRLPLTESIIREMEWVIDLLKK